MPESLVRVMPDVAAARAPAAGAIEWVGMQGIDLPVELPGPDGVGMRVPARVDAFVDLAAEARGIHMSRLYLDLERRLGGERLSPRVIGIVLRDFLDSHRGLSRRARLVIRFEQLLRRRALVSDTHGWKRYPVTLVATLDGAAIAAMAAPTGASAVTLELATEVLYSSTCPCSAALARQLIQEQFRVDFPRGTALERERVLAWLGSEHGILATPHSQRSRLQMRVRISPDSDELPIVELIDGIEHALATPVQTAVKREDEQAFARLNGANLMFCEDAGRRARSALDAAPQALDFWARAIHEESLHAHDAVAVVTKGVPGGFDGQTRFS